MVDFSKITYNWDAINDYPNDDLTITITTKVKEITDAVYEMEENAFRSVVVDRMRELGYLVYEPDKHPKADPSALKLHRTRRYLDVELERVESQIEAFKKVEHLKESVRYLEGVRTGLMKARIQIFTPEESDESWRVRKEMFG